MTEDQTPAPIETDDVVAERAPEPAPGGSHQVGRALTARGLTLRSIRGTVFGPVDVDLPPGVPGAVLGTQGSGRSALLLALVGRLQGAGGELTLGDMDGIRHPHRLRRATTVARITDYVELEPLLTIRECIDEHCLAEGISRRTGRKRFARLEAAVGFHPDHGDQVSSLPVEDRTILTCMLACLRPADVIVYDDIDSSLTRPQLEHVYRVLETLGRLGHRFVVSALTSAPVPRGAVVVELPTPGHDDLPAALPTRPSLED